MATDDAGFVFGKTAFFTMADQLLQLGCGRVDLARAALATAVTLYWSEGRDAATAAAWLRTMAQIVELDAVPAEGQARN